MPTSPRWIAAFTLGIVMACTGTAQDRPAVFVGKVFSEGKLQPIVGAEVSIAELEKSAPAGEKGAFRLVDIPAGTYTVRVRHIGFARFESRITFKAGATVERAIVLPAAAPLDTLRVVGEVRVPLSFLEHKATGLGHFLTREELDKSGEQPLHNLLAVIPGAGIVRGKSGSGFLMSKRFAIPLSQSINGRPARVNLPGDVIWYPDGFVEGAVAGCYARVYVDRTLMNSTSPAEPVNLREFHASDIEAVEFYSGSSQTPLEYARANADCGVLVIHRRKAR